MILSFRLYPSESSSDVVLICRFISITVLFFGVFLSLYKGKWLYLEVSAPLKLTNFAEHPFGQSTVHKAVNLLQFS